MSFAVFTPLPALVLSALLVPLTRWAQSPQPATALTPIHQQIGLWRSLKPTSWLQAMRGDPLPPVGNTEKAVNMPWSPAARLGLGSQPPRKVATGNKARIRLWQRLRSLLLLAIIVVVGGSLLAGMVGLLLFAAGFFVEQAIG